MITKDFDILKDELAAEGFLAIPEILDDDFRLKWNKAATRYDEEPIVTDANSENVESSVSEWIPSRKKKKKKGKKNGPPPPLGVRQSSRVRYATEVKNPDFFY